MSKKKSGQGKAGAKFNAPKQQSMRNSPMSRRPPRQPGR
jgi:hypothetical protein